MFHLNICHLLVKSHEMLAVSCQRATMNLFLSAYQKGENAKIILWDMKHALRGPIANADRRERSISRNIRRPTITQQQAMSIRIVCSEVNNFQESRTLLLRIFRIFRTTQDLWKIFLSLRVLGSLRSSDSSK